MKRLMVLVLAAAGASSFAGTFTLGSTGDARITSFEVDTNFRNDGLSTSTSSISKNRSLLQFDLSSIPGTETITSAVLRLSGHSNSGSGNSTSVDVFRVTRSWLENEVTWDQAQNFQDWTTPGGEAAGTTGVQWTNPYSTTAVNAGTGYAYIDMDVTLLVQQWQAGTFSNFGFALASPLGSTLDYTSSEGTRRGEAGTFGDTPQLVITTVPEPASLCALGIGAVALLKRRRGSRR